MVTKESNIQEAIKKIEEKFSVKYIGSMQFRAAHIYMFNDPQHHKSTISITKTQLFNLSEAKKYMIDFRKRYNGENQN